MLANSRIASCATSGATAWLRIRALLRRAARPSRPAERPGTPPRTGIHDRPRGAAGHGGRHPAASAASLRPRAERRSYVPRTPRSSRPSTRNFWRRWLAGWTGHPAKPPSETQMFRRDLEMYRRWGQRPAAAVSAGRAGESPFRDRCALLLDPAMMEQARRGAADFESEILRTAAQRFRQLGRSHVSSARSPRHRGAKAPRRRRAKVPRRNTKRKPPRHSVKRSRRKKRKSAAHRKPSRR